jgi:hypothetical protein
MITLPFITIFLLLVGTHAQVPQDGTAIIPEWSCWFNAYTDEKRVFNLLFMYNNTMDSDVMLPTTVPENRITPSTFNGHQTDIFKAGVDYYAFVLEDGSDYLSSEEGAQIVWRVGSLETSVTKSGLTEERRCDLKYEGVCPQQKFPHFCDDGVYCNGEESCFSQGIMGAQTTTTLGHCTRPLNGVQCGVQQECSESLLRCIDITPPPPPPPAIYPRFDCWFYQYENENAMSMNLKLGYNSTGTNLLVRAITTDDTPSGTIANKISPSAYNGQQPALFEVGYNPGSFSIKDSIGILERENGTITWFLTDFSLVIQQSDITPDTKCPEQDSEAPTDPIDTVTDGDEDTEGDGTQCSAENTDCTSYDTFCHGITACNVDSGYCVLVNEAYNPCSVSASEVTQGAPLRTECVESAQICISVINCTLDSECNDGLLCSGPVLCINNTCVDQNQTLEERCGLNTECVEGVGCLPLEQPISSAALVSIFGVGIGLFVLIVFVIYIYFWSHGKIKKSKNK